jgi:anti-sigma factor RsiW
MSCAEFSDLLGAYALRSLDPAEAEAVAHHLATCADCRAELEGHRAVVDALPFAIETLAPATPPPALRARILSAATSPSADRPAPSAPIPAETATGSAGVPPAPVGPASLPVGAGPGGIGGSPVPPARAAGPAAAFRRWLGASIRLRRGYVLAGLGLAFVLLLLSTLFLQAAATQLRTERAASDALREEERQVAAVLTSPQGRVWSMEPPPGAPAGPLGRMYTAPEQGLAVVALRNFSPPALGQAYQLWITENGERENAGIVPLEPDGTSLIVYRSAGAVSRYDECRVTLEPAQGSGAPAGPTVVLWRREP